MSSCEFKKYLKNHSLQENTKFVFDIKRKSIKPHEYEDMSMIIGSVSKLMMMDGERIEEHLLQSEDRKRRFASNACEASAYD